MTIVLSTLFVLTFVYGAVFVGERLAIRNVFGPYVSEVSRDHIEHAIREHVDKNKLHLSRDEWRNGMLHTDTFDGNYLQYLAFHDDNWTVPDFYAMSVLENGERKSYRVREGTDLFVYVRNHHKNLMKQRQ